MCSFKERESSVRVRKEREERRGRTHVNSESASIPAACPLGGPPESAPGTAGRRKAPDAGFPTSAPSQTSSHRGDMCCPVCHHPPPQRCFCPHHHTSKTTSVPTVKQQKSMRFDQQQKFLTMRFCEEISRNRKCPFS